MGFKQIHHFNVALLGKQGWRLLTNPNSLVARVFQARYYPKSSFMEASIGHNPSYCWRSILASQDMLKAGSRKRVGNGLTTKVWGDPWLLDADNPWLTTDMPVQLTDAKVANLMTIGGQTWDSEVVNDLFNQRDARQILATPICPDYCDSWYWSGDIRGNYSVKLGYRVLTGGGGVPSSPFSRWKTLWGLKIPPKWRSLLWRAVRDVLPTKLNLIYRHVAASPECPTCGLEEETVMHVFFNCPMACEVWRRSGLHVVAVVHDSFAARLEDFFLAF